MSEKEDGVTVYEVIKAIHQAASDAFDGSDKKIGLKREEGNPIVDSRVMDGFGVSINGNVLKVTYQSECTMKEVGDKRFSADIADMFAEITKYLKAEYKSRLKSTLKLSEIMKEPDILVQSVSRTHTWVQAHQTYKIDNIDMPEDEEHENILKEDSSWDFKKTLRSYMENDSAIRTREGLRGDKLVTRSRWGGRNPFFNSGE